jgi:hypothetical protein
MPLLNYRTTVAAAKSAAEIQGKLAAFGARQVTIDYDAGQPAALAFVLAGVTASGEAWHAPFRLPANVDGVAAVLKRQRVGATYQKPEHVRNVAWRTLKDWVEAQLAIVESGLVRPEQALLPYMVASDDRTLFEHFEASPKRLLAA